MTKKQEDIKTDALVTGYANTLDFYHTHTRLVYIVLGTMVGLIVLFGGWSVYSSNQEKEAQAFFVDAESALIKRNYAAALNGDGVNNIGFLAIAKDFRFTETGNLANFYAAVSASQLNEFDTALEFITKFDAPKGVMGVGAIGLHGSILESMGQFDKAAVLYKKAAEWDKNESTTPVYLLKAANAALKAGNTKDALRFADEVITRYSASSSAAQASQIKSRASVGI